jgi:hypothetical protein
LSYVFANLAGMRSDEWVFPHEWYRHRWQRRGSAGLAPIEPDRKAAQTVEQMLTLMPEFVLRVLRNPATEPALARAGQSWLDGDPAAPPAGAAAVAAATGTRSWGERNRYVAFADVWIATRGVRFAAEAAVEFMALVRRDDGHNFAARTGPPPPPVEHMLPAESRNAWGAPDPPLQVALRVRAALAAAPAEVYAETVAALAAQRDAGAFQRVATSVLAPTETAWVEQDLAEAIADKDQYRGTALLTAATTPEQVTALATASYPFAVVRSLALLTTFVDGAGPAAAPTLLRWLDGSTDSDAESRRRVLSVLAALPGEEALRGLVDRVDQKYVRPALLAAAGRFPARALRLLADSAARSTLAELLKAHVLAHPEVVARVLPELSAEAARRIGAITGAAVAVQEAPLSALPPLLADPPWLRRRRTARPLVVSLPPDDSEPILEWRDGERETWWKADFHAYWSNPQEGWAEFGRRVAEGRVRWAEPGHFFVHAPDEQLAREVLAAWQPQHSFDIGRWLLPLVARFELDALPTVLELARRNPADMDVVIGPFAAPALAPIVADWLARLKTMRRPALAWLHRHPAAAVRALLPAALGPAGVPRRQAEQALLALVTAGHQETLRSVAASLGAGAGAAVEVLLATDPLELRPARIPAQPDWAEPGLLPPVLMRDGSGALPASAVAHVVTALAISKPGEPYAGVDVIRAACTPESLAEFGWGLFRRWQGAGMPAKDGWVLDALGLIGDDETVRRLTPVIQAWPGEGGHARAVAGVRVLAAIGSDVALMHLHGVAQRAKFRGLKAAAEEKMAEVAAALGLSPDQLADRLVPGFGLDTRGSMTLDYGPRQFVVGFDEQLRPYAADATGKRLKALPKPGARDDAELAPAAYKAFSGLKKDVRTVAADQIRRLERAMVSGRRWSGHEFRTLFVDHPLLRHIVRRLVWARFDESGEVIGALRVAEDRTFADAHDDPAELPGDATVGVAHPLHLGGTVPDWAGVFADYEILQPFPQLGREVYRLTREEAAGPLLRRFDGRTAPATKVVGLERRGWRREDPQDSGHQGSIELPAGRHEVVVWLDPGINVGDITMFPEQAMREIWVRNASDSRWRTGSRLPLGALGAVLASEVIRDLTEVTS